jgi:hypothetical protein
MTFWLTSIGDLRSVSSSAPLWQTTYRIATFIWAAILLIVSLQPRRPANFHSSIAHHVAHLLAFGALAFLATVGFGDARRIALWPATAAFLFGFAIEFVQHVHNRKSIEWHDVRDNAIGILAFTALCHMIYWWPATAKKSSRATETLDTV